MNVIILTFHQGNGENLGCALEGFGHDVTVDGITLGQSHPFIKLWRMFRLVLRQKGKPDAIIVENPFWDALVTLLLAGLDRNVRVIFYVKAFNPEIMSASFPMGFKRFGFGILRRLVRRADYIVYSSQWVKQRYSKNSPVPEIETKPCTIIHHSPDPAIINTTMLHITEPNLESENREILISYVSRFGIWDKARGGIVILNALSEILQNNPRLVWRLYIAGDGDHLGILREKATELKLTERIVFTGWLGPMQLEELYRTSDIFVYSSFQDGCPKVVMEAQAYGLPVVVTTGSGASELVMDGVTGLVCSPEANEVADALVVLMENPSKRRSMGVKARSHIERNLTWEVCASNFDAVLKELVHEK